MTPLRRHLHGTTYLVRDPVSIGTAILGSSLAATPIIGSLTLGSLVGNLVMMVVSSFIQAALAPKPPSLDDLDSGGLLTNIREPAAPRRIIYGETRVGGNVTYIESTGNKNRYLHMVISLAGHEVDSIGTIYVNDEPVTLDANGFVTGTTWKSRIRIKTHLGTANQVVDPDLRSESTIINNNFRGRGVAYLYVRLDYNQDVFAGGIPTFSAVVRGKKVFDPRTSTTAWSDNAALCVRDYITSTIGLNDQSIDDTYFAAAANVCDELVTLSGGGTEPRYTINGSFTLDQRPGFVLDQMMNACAGMLFLGGGQWKLKPGYYTPPVKTFTLDDLRGPISLNTRVPRRDNFNTVRGKFNDKDQDWIEADFPEVRSATFIAEDGGNESALDLGTPFTTSSAASQRLAKLALFRGREQMAFEADFSLAAMDVEVGDVVALTFDRYGWTAKEFEVVGWRILTNGEAGDIRVRMSLRETSAAAFDWNAEEQDIIANNTELNDPFRPIEIGLSLSSEVRVINEHLTNVIYATVTTTEPFNIDRVEVQFKKTSDVNWSVAGSGDPGTYEILDTLDETYDIRARSYSMTNIRGDWVTYSGFVVSGLAQPPADVTNFTATLLGGSIYLEWSPVPDLDLSFYRIRYAPELSGATWANATTAVEKVARPGNAFTIPARPGTYMIRAFDKTGNASVNYASVVVRPELMESYTTTFVQTEHPAFTGANTGTAVVANELQIANVTGTAPFVVEYEFAAPIDTGAVRKFRAYIDANVRRVDNGSLLWDSLPGLVDALPGLIDDTTGLAQFDDTNLRFYISTTNTDPLASPVWEPWQVFKAGDFYARAARFKIEMESTTVNVTPSISFLQAVVQHN